MKGGGYQDESCGCETGNKRVKETEVAEICLPLQDALDNAFLQCLHITFIYVPQNLKSVTKILKLFVVTFVVLIAVDSEE